MIAAVSSAVIRAVPRTVPPSLAHVPLARAVAAETIMGAVIPRLSLGHFAQVIAAQAVCRAVCMGFSENLLTHAIAAMSADDIAATATTALLLAILRTGGVCFALALVALAIAAGILAILRTGNRRLTFALLAFVVTAGRGFCEEYPLPSKPYAGAKNDQENQPSQKEKCRALCGASCHASIILEIARSITIARNKVLLYRARYSNLLIPIS